MPARICCCIRADVMYVRFAANSGRSHDLGRWFQFAPSAALGYSPIVTLEICGGRVEVSAPLQTRVVVATEFVVIGGGARRTVLSVRRRTSQPLMGRCRGAPIRLQSRQKTNSAGITARVVQRMIAVCTAAFPTVKFTYTSSFQYSLTSYLRTSSTQVVSRPCREISRL
jgi:hypothetical protein